jgi:hypothetical protein
MDNMIERVARAIQASEGGPPAEDAYWSTPCTGSIYYTRAASAAIEAMREPTVAMRQAGADNLFGAASDDWKDDAGAIWSAMIEVALSPSPAPAGERL